MPRDKLSIEIEIKKIGDELKIVQREMKDLSNTIKKEGSEIRTDTERTHKSFKTHWLAISAILAGATYAAIKAGKSLVEAAGEAETFATQLIALTGVKAKEWFKDLTEFGAKTPHMTQDVVQSFILLQSVGLKPTMQMMRTLGDTAFLFGRTMEEVASSMVSTLAITIRRLGVEMDRTGKQAKLTSGDIMLFVENTAEGIRKGLLEIWEKRFGGAMKIAEKTWRGALALFWSGVWEMRAALGDILLPGLKIIVQQLTNIVFRVRDWAKTHREAAQDIMKNSILEIIGGLEKLTIATGYVTDAWYYLRRFIVGSRIFFADFFRSVTGMAKDFLEAFNIAGALDKQIDALERVERIWASVVQGEIVKSDELISRHEAIRKGFEKIRAEIKNMGKEAEKQWPELTNLIDLLSKTGGAAPGKVPPPETGPTKEAIALNERLKDEVIKLTKTKLEQLEIWRQEQLAVKGVNEEYVNIIYNIKREALEREANIEAAKKYTQEWLEAYKKTDDYYDSFVSKNKEATNRIKMDWDDLKSNLQWSLEAGFFDIFKGGVDDIGGYFRQFCQSLVDVFARAVAKMIAEWLIFKAVTQIGSAIGSLFGGGGTEVIMAQHGLMLTEPTLGLGLKTGQRYLFGEAGPEAVVPARGFSQSREMTQNIYLVDERPRTSGLGPDDVVIVVSDDIRSDGPIRKTIKRFI